MLIPAICAAQQRSTPAPPSTKPPEPNLKGMAGHWAVESARPVNPGGPSGSPKPKAISARNCKFESISLQRRVYCGLDFRGQLVCEAIDLPKVLKTITFSPARV